MKKPEAPGPKPGPPAKKKPYRPPKLSVYGKLSEITGKHDGSGDDKGGSGIVA